MKKLVISIVLLNLLAACSGTKAPDNSALGQPGDNPIVTPQPTPTPPPVVETDELNNPQSILAKRSVYYPLDVAVVQDADKPIVQAHAEYLSSHANRKVRVEGNCDERGSNEYNLALGQRRADGVQQLLVKGGAKAEQLESFSYGEEKTDFPGHDEAAWKQNRRTDLNYAK